MTAEIKMMNSSKQSNSRRWVARAVIASLALILISLDQVELLSTSNEDLLRRRRLQDDQGEEIQNNQGNAEAVAALTALETSMNLLDELIASDKELSNEQQGEADQDNQEEANEEKQEPVNSDSPEATDQQQPEAEGEPSQEQAQPEQDQPEQTQDQADPQQQQEEQEKEQESNNQSVQEAAKEALGETPHHFGDFIPQPIQSREKYFGKVFPETNHVDMPFYLRNTFEPEPLNEENRDIILYWHIPKTGGQLVKNIMGMCFGLKRPEKLKEPASLEMVHDVIVNVDTSSPEGIAEAHELGLVDSNMVDFISSSYVLSASSLFTPQHRGRAFTILRHPIDAAAHNFHARKVKHPDLRGKYTLAQYAGMDYYIDNWVTRQLTGTLPHEELEQRHVDQAKNILAAKFFVGIYEQLDETMRQLKAFYKWKSPEGQEYCVTDLIHGSNPKFQKTWRGKPARGSVDWAFVANVERWDMDLYYFALEVFSKQGRIWDSETYSLIGREDS